MTTGQSTTLPNNFTPLPVEKPLPTHDQLHEALLYTQDMLERCMIPFVALDDLAHSFMYNEPSFKMEELSFGVMRRHWTESGRAMFRTLVKGADLTNVNVSFYYKSVPVVIWIIERDYAFFKNPDSKYYCATEFCIPNPFRDYWKSRDLIK